MNFPFIFLPFRVQAMTYASYKLEDTTLSQKKFRVRVKMILKII